MGGCGDRGGGHLGRWLPGEIGALSAGGQGSLGPVLGNGRLVAGEGFGGVRMRGADRLGGAVEIGPLIHRVLEQLAPVVSQLHLETGGVAVAQQLPIGHGLRDLDLELSVDGNESLADAQRNPENTALILCREYGQNGVFGVADVEGVGATFELKRNVHNPDSNHLEAVFDLVHVFVPGLTYGPLLLVQLAGDAFGDIREECNEQRYDTTVRELSHFRLSLVTYRRIASRKYLIIYLIMCQHLILNKIKNPFYQGN